MATEISVEVVYVEPNHTFSQSVSIPVNSTVVDAIQTSGLFDEFPHLNRTIEKVGIYSKIVEMSQLLKSGDRIEVYRPLIFDPKETRRKRALQGAKKTTR